MRVSLHGVGILLLMGWGVLFSTLPAQASTRAEARVRLEGDTVVKAPTMTKEEIMAMSYDDLINLDLDILMDLANETGMSVDELMEMAMNRKATIASRKAESIFDSPLTTYVITADDIAQSGYTLIPELFNMVPGALVRQKTNGNYDVTFHGMDNVPPENPMIVRENTTLLLMIDNRVVYDQFSGGIFWEALPISVNDIERIDVVMGAASALYGPNAMTGVINIVTQKGSVRAGAKGIADAGMDGKRDAMLNVAIPITERWSSRLYGYIQHADRFETDYYSYPMVQKLPADKQINYMMLSPYITPRSQRLQQIGMLRYGGTGNLFYEGPEHLRVSLSAGGQYSEAQTAGFNNLVTPINLRTNASVFGAAVVDYNQLHVQANIRHADFDLDQGMRTPYNTAFHSLTADALMNGDFNVGYGLSFQPEFSVVHTSIEDEESSKNFDPLLNDGQGGQAASYMDGKKELSLASGSIRLEYKPIDQLRFVAAVRYDFYAQIQRQAMGWQAVAVYAPTPNHIIRANYSRASRSLFHMALFADVDMVPVANTSYSLFDMGGTPGVIEPPMKRNNQFLQIKGNRNLEIPALDYFELGYRGNFGQYLQADIILFTQTIRKLDAPEVEDIVVPNFIPKMGDWQRMYAYYEFQNLSMNAAQLGGTISLTSMPLGWLTVRSHLTMQLTALNEYRVPDGHKFDYNMLTTKGQFAFVRKEGLHTSTPLLYGGLGLHFTPLRSKRLSINVHVNGRSNQLYAYAKVIRDSHPLIQTAIPSAVWADVSVAYRILPGITVFATGQNLGRTQAQYALTDVVRPTVYAGFRVDF